MVPAPRGRRPSAKVSVPGNLSGHGPSRARSARALAAPSWSSRAHEASRGRTRPGGDGGLFKGAEGRFFSGSRLAAVALVPGLPDAGRLRRAEPRGGVARGAGEPRAGRPARRRVAPLRGWEGHAHALAPVPGLPPAPPRRISSRGRDRFARRRRRARERPRRNGRPLETPFLRGGRPVDRGHPRDRPGRHAHVVLVRVLRKHARRPRAVRADDDPRRRRRTGRSASRDRNLDLADVVGGRRPRRRSPLGGERRRRASGSRAPSAARSSSASRKATTACAWRRR